MDLRIEISRYLERRFGLNYDAEKEIIVTVGGSEGIDLAVRAMINPGDEVHEFTGANETIGTVILRCDTREEMDSYFAKIDEYVTIDVE